jgi:hypothetical protein
VLALALSSCRSDPRTEVGSLRCQYAFKDGSFIGLFSFALGELPAPPVDPAQVDLVYYFDADDCSRGALLGSDDEPGSIVPVGVRPRSDLAELMRPTDGAETLAAISPVTNDKEGLAFWVRTRDRGYVLVRLTAVEEASYADLRSGRTPILKFEWLVPAG